MEIGGKYNFGSAHPKWRTQELEAGFLAANIWNSRYLLRLDDS